MWEDIQQAAVMRAFQDQDRGVGRTRTCLPAPWRPGVLGEIPEGSAAGTAADSPRHRSRPPSRRAGSERVCARERRAAAGGGAGALLARLQPRAERRVWGSWWQHHSAAARRSTERSHPPLPRERPGCGGIRAAAAAAAPGTRARSSLRSPACADLPRLAPKNVSQVQGDPVLVLSCRGTGSSLQNQGEGTDQDNRRGSGISPGRPEGRGQGT